MISIVAGVSGIKAPGIAGGYLDMAWRRKVECNGGTFWGFILVLGAMALAFLGLVYCNFIVVYYENSWVGTYYKGMCDSAY